MGEDTEAGMGYQHGDDVELGRWLKRQVDGAARSLLILVPGSAAGRLANRTITDALDGLVLAMSEGGRYWRIRGYAGDVDLRVLRYAEPPAHIAGMMLDAAYWLCADARLMPEDWQTAIDHRLYVSRRVTWH